MRTIIKEIIFRMLFCCIFVVGSGHMAQAEVKTYYNEKGIIRREVGMENGMLNGISREYYENGNLYEESFYKNGAVEGATKTYYEDGKTLHSEIWRENSIDGRIPRWDTKHVQYDREGNIIFKEDSRNNIPPDGIKTTYRKNGNLLTKEIYVAGEILEEIRYDRDNKITFQKKHDLFKYFPLVVNISIDKKEYRSRDLIEIDFVIKNRSLNDVEISLYNEDSWVEGCILKTPAGSSWPMFEKPNSFKRENESVLMLKTKILKPNETYHYKLKGKLKDVSEDYSGEIFWKNKNQPILWKRPEEKPRAFTGEYIRLTSNKVSIMIKPYIFYEMLKAAGIALETKSCAQWFALLKNDDALPYQKVAALEHIIGQAHCQRRCKCDEYNFYNYRQFFKTLRETVKNDKSSMVRISAAMAWLDWSIGSSYKGNKEVLPVIVQILNDEDVYASSLAETALNAFIGTFHHLEENPENAKIVLKAISKEISMTKDDSKKETLKRYKGYLTDAVEYVKEDNMENKNNRVRIPKELLILIQRVVFELIKIRDSYLELITN